MPRTSPMPANPELNAQEELEFLKCILGPDAEFLRLRSSQQMSEGENRGRKQLGL